MRDPVAALPVARTAPVTVEDRAEGSGGRTLRHVALREPGLGEIRFVVSLPDPLPAGRLPVIVVLGGLARGQDNLAPLPDPGDNAVLAYDWPLPPSLPTGLDLLGRAPDLHRRVLSVPGQVDAALAWATEQGWADPERVSLLGFSLGALAAPAAQRLAEGRGQRIGWTVLAYGGAPIGDLLSDHPLLRPRWAGPPLGAAADLLLRPVEPLRHLPHLGGRFLVLSGRDDRLIPARAAKTLRDATPQPRAEVAFEGDHMGVGPGQRALLDMIIRASTTWLLDQKAVNPPPSGEG
jgi:dienelactone hydrolase